MQENKLIDGEYTRFITSVVDTSKEVELALEDVPIIQEYVSIFSQGPT